MTDVFDKAKRAEVMSKIRAKGNKTTEMALALAFKKWKITGWRRHISLKPLLAIEDQQHGEILRRISIRPDFLFRTKKVAVFVDGCFWHGCPMHGTKPATNKDFWETKLTNNVSRDQRAKRALEAAGWKVVRFWEHELKQPESVVMQLIQVLDTQPKKG